METQSPLIPKKVRRSIQKAAIDAGYNLKGMADLNLIDQVTKGIMEAKGNKNTVTHDIILNRLDKTEYSIARSWKNFEKRYKSLMK